MDLKQIKRIKFLGLGFLLMSVATQASELKVGGYADLEYQMQHVTNRQNTFMVGDSVITLKKEMDNAQFFVKIPFSTPSTGATTSAFQVFQTKGQAWVAYKYESGLSWKIGQIGKVFGVQDPDSGMRFFSRGGLLQPSSTNSGLWDANHPALVLSYDLTDSMSLMGYVADPPAKSGIFNGTINDNYDFGLQLKGKDGGLAWSLGGRRWQRKANYVLDELLDAYLSYNMDEWTFEANADWKKSAYSLQTGTGYYLQIIYALSDKLSLGTRGEYVLNGNYTTTTIAATTTTPAVTTYAQIYRQKEIAVGPEYNFTKSFRARLDGAYGRTQATSKSGSTNTKTGTMSVVYKF